MLVAWFRGLGIDPAYGLTEVECNRPIPSVAP